MLQPNVFASICPVQMELLGPNMLYAALALLYQPPEVLTCRSQLAPVIASRLRRGNPERQDLSVQAWIAMPQARLATTMPLSAVRTFGSWYHWLFGRSFVA